ncbi:hypothetical protein QU661_00800 [Mogibacterium neglectum]|uniref:hypothetical protein n=1 Tax=Mogibacterium neglectum TaxID=114528 RepID=UPI00272D6294|nr:hypothetical protein [Mogibacterium neglectum]WLD76415.1 hypothetical protein QU661_00800 [Mogibacterium neglectum]
MKDANSQYNFNGTTNFNGSVQFAGGDIINESSTPKQVEATYKAEPKWRSPFTIAVLSWISVIIGILSLIPIGKIFISALNLLKGNFQAVSNFSVQVYLIFLIILVFLFVVFLSFRRIVKKQIRVPLPLNYAISGHDRHLTLEKIHINKCPQCGGKMKYYNKPVEWIDKYYSDGKTKREVTKRIPVLECTRNSEHCYKVDPAEDKVK